METKQEFFKRYLVSYRYGEVFNHGEVWINDAGFLKCGTPVEDFGTLILQDSPFPDDENQIFQMILDIV